MLLLRHEPEAEPPAPNPFLTDVSHRLDDEAEDDAFGHRDYVDVLDETVPRLPSPFTLGLFGAWGSGKSSILEALGARVVRREDAAFARFDAWKYEGDPLRRQLMLAVTAQLGKTGKLKRRFSVRRHLERYDADIAGSRPRLELDWRGVVKAFVHAGFAAAFVYGLFRLLPELGVGETNTLKTTLTAATGAVTFVLTAVAGVVGIQRQQVTRHRLEDADQFAESFERLLRKGLAVPRLVIGVDNLDRCAPERVTEILAIIKTFLEPAREETEKALVFVIAADDAAIRRHLIAQEMAVSAATATPATQDDGQAATAEERVPDDVVRAVDEYLRKYFNGVIRLPTVIDEDVEGFVRTQLAGFADEHDLDAETRRSLTTLVGEFLEGNPRRIKQFVNGLELRVKLLRRRNDARRLGGPPDSLTVAEVMLIEERWPHRFATLCREPGQISEWHRRAVNEPNPPSVSRDEADWLRFLRSSERICRVPLAPYLVLKRSMPELRLEHHDAFVTALESRETERIRALLPELGRKREEYLDLVWTHFRRHLAHDRDGAAHVIFMNVLDVPELRPAGDDRLSRMTREAVRRPAMLARLLSEPQPDLVIALGDGLAEHDRRQLVLRVLGEFSGRGPDGSRRREAISKALCERVASLADEHRHALRFALGRPHVAADIESWVDIGEAAPGVVPTEAIATLIEHLERTRFAPDAPAFRVLCAIVQSKLDCSTWIERFVKVVKPVLEGGGPESAEVRAALPRFLPGLAGPTNDDYAPQAVDKRQQSELL